MHSVRSYNKVLTALLAFKVLSVYSAYAKYSLCALRLDSSLILAILHNASRAIYESLFLGTLCVLSCGLFLVSGALPVIRIRFLSLFISLLYLLVSTENLLPIRNLAFVTGLGAGVWAVCLVMSYLTYRTLSELIRETYILHLDSFRAALLRKKAHFLATFWVIQAYFLGKLLFHLLLPPFSVYLTSNMSNQLSILLATHEFLEFITSIAIISLYLQATESPAVDLRLSAVSSCQELPLFVSESTLNLREVEADMNWERPLLIASPGSALMVGFLEGGTGEFVENY